MSSAGTRSSDRTATLSSLQRAFDLIDVIARTPAPGIGLTNAANEAGLPKAASHRILKSLYSLDVVAFDDTTKLYMLGPGALRIGLAAFRQVDVPRIARPYLERLASRTNETATLSMKQGDSRIYLDQIMSTQEVKMTVQLGEPYPLFAGASSKAILSTFNECELSHYLNRIALAAVTVNTLTSTESLHSELKSIRKLGYSVSRGERQPDAASVAAPVFRADGSVFGAISVCEPLQRFRELEVSEIGKLVKQVASELSLDLGHATGRQGTV